VRTKAATPAPSRETNSFCRVRMWWSFVSTTQPRLPTSGSHSVSFAACRKYVSWISTVQPALRSAPATIPVPRARSMKNVGDSGCGGELELAADRFFDLFFRPIVVSGEISDPVARLVAISDYEGGNPGPC
jgi:hypothetical protein